ncbi:PREDICTED: centrin-3-like isoform X2 [Priapulus caudatus]|uniref:Centrin-3-like isoform X1 n=1 Tax=Priapulus caudatus TaxID=37621 RepID=A0ABM1ESN3_PRICU|nr:PREDICTED: centrin-3-like isoform X1 [Priapulus caudatus]XP_014675206.1 PREDICTED: centrin-3-like isoform X2 [Priapulus caudatus]
MERGRRPARMTESRAGRGKRQDLSLSEEQKVLIRETFELFDSDHDSLINYDELKVALQALGFDAKKHEVLNILQAFDREGNGKMYFQDFKDVVTEKMAEEGAMEEAEKAFRLFEGGAMGKVGLRGLRSVSQQLNEDINDEDLQAMIDEFDKNGDGAIDLDEFRCIILGDDT